MRVQFHEKKKLFGRENNNNNLLSFVVAMQVNCFCNAGLGFLTWKVSIVLHSSKQCPEIV